MLQDFSAVFSAGKCTCIMGDSGAGKTTLLRILMGTLPADGGSIQGTEGRKPSAVFQEDRLCDSLNAVANIAFACSPSLSRDKIVKHLTVLGLGDSLRQPVRELSGGMRRRVAIARAILADGDILYLDEPLKGLDDQNKEMVARYILQYTEGKTTLMVTHSHEEVARMNADLVMVKLAR